MKRSTLIPFAVLLLAASLHAQETHTDSVAHSVRRSEFPVILNAVIGAGLGGALGYYLDKPTGSLNWTTGMSAGVTLGAAGGAMLGAIVMYRPPSPLLTALGAAVGAVPLFYFMREDNGDAAVVIAVPLTVLPILGAWIGNRSGRGH